jgi:pimeloyl-ACP methyl ester carboxylesterase
MDKTAFSAPTLGGVLSGWVAGDGPPVLFLHGGPGLSYTLVDGAADELVPSFRVASFQQRGLPPSVEQGPFTIEQALADVVAVLDHFGWERAYVVGNSWGGHLAFHIAVALPDRLLGVLAIDPLGAVGDGGMAAFEAEMLARTPEQDRERAEALDKRAMQGEGTEADAVEALRLLWPAYFADPSTAPPLPPVRLSLAATALMDDVVAALPGLEKSLPDIQVPLGVLVGARSPMPPQEAGLASAERVPGGWGISVPDAGHLPWYERPGCVAAAMNRLAGSAEQAS